MINCKNVFNRECLNDICCGACEEINRCGDACEQSPDICSLVVQTDEAPIDNPVSHPSHYTDGKIEVIDFIEDKKLNYHRGNAVKYISRAGKKDPAKEIEDLRKAAWYLDREINRMEAANHD